MRSVIGISICCRGVFTVGVDVRLLSMEKAKVDPTPAWELSAIRPPCSSVRSLAMKRPKPEPPYLDSVLAVRC